MTTTEKGEYVPGSMKSGVERRNLRTLILASVIVSGLGYVGWRVTWGVVGLGRVILVT